MTYAGDLLRSGQGYSVSSADQIVMLCRLIARPDRIGFSAPKVEQAIDARREVTNGLLIPRRETRSGSRPAGASVRPKRLSRWSHGEDVHRSGGRTPAPEAGCSPRCPQGRGESNGSQDCRDILNAVPKRNPMIVPTAPVRKITSACGINQRWRTGRLHGVAALTGALPGKTVMRQLPHQSPDRF